MQKCDTSTQRVRREQLDADQTETKSPDKDQVLLAGRAVYRLLFVNVGVKHK